MKRRALLSILLTLFLLTSCASMTKKPSPLELEVISVTDKPLVKLSATKGDLEAAGYRIGDWALIELDGFGIKVQVSDKPQMGSTTLVVSDQGSYLSLPTAINSTSTGLLIPYPRGEERAQSSVSFSGNFVFSL